MLVTATHLTSRTASDALQENLVVWLVLKKTGKKTQLRLVTSKKLDAESCRCFSLLLVQLGLFVEMAGRTAADAVWWLQWRDGAWAIDDLVKVPGRSHKNLVIITSGDDSLKIL
jgi:hypothetical protein